MTSAWKPDSFSMPYLGGAYPPLPYVYDSAETMFVVFDTDTAAIAPLLPPGLELMKPARGVVSLVKAATSPLGGYNEVWVGVRVTWKNEPLTFMLFCILDNDIAMLAGREIWGIPKKLGKVSLKWHRETYHGYVERPESVRLCSVTAQLGAAIPESEDVKPPSGVCLRQIPSPEEGGEPLVELIKLGSEQYHYSTGTGARMTWQAEAQLELFSGSKQDPWGIVPVVNVKGARYVKGGGRYLGYGEILHRYSG